MKPVVALLMLCLRAHTSSCSAQNETVRAGNAASIPGPTTPAIPIVLGDKDGRVQLTFSSNGNPLQEAGGVRLRAFDEVLLGIPERNLSPGKATPRPPAILWLDGRAFEATATNLIKMLDRRSSNDWEFASLDLTPAFGPRVKQFRRHLLFVQPDLIVICDELSPTEPAAVQTGWCFPNELIFDAVRDEWRLQLPKAGLTARAFSSPRGGLNLLAASDAVNANAASGLKCLRMGVTNKIDEYHQITVLVPHEKDARRSLAFKLLESDTAIGVRVHRDGLPTLIAFRKSTTPGEANLTGLKFTGPVAVDVFRSKRK